MAAEAPQILVNDAIRRQVLLEGVKSSEFKKFGPFLKDLEKSLRERITREGQTIRNRARLTKLLSDVRKIQLDTFNGYTEQLELDLDDIAITEGLLESKSITAATETFEAVLPSNDQLIAAYRNNPLSVRGKSQGMTLNPFIKQYTDDQVALISGTISQGFAEGQTTQQIVTNLRGTRANNFKDGVLANVDRNTRTMVRTAVQNSSAQAKQRVWDRNNDIVEGVEWVSTLDSRTTNQCRSLDGQVFATDDGPRPPIHPGCRSTTAPALGPEFDFLKEGSKRPARGQDSDGKVDITQVNTDTTYYSWLKNQPKMFQDEVLGPTRAKLLRNGGLNSEQFANLQLNKNFKALTLEEMAEIAPEAFEQANLLNDAGDVKVVRN